MVMSTINIENDVRRRYNRRVLFCIRIRYVGKINRDILISSNGDIFRGAALLIGLWDLFIHSIGLLTLVLMFGQAPYAKLDSPVPHSNDIAFHRHLDKQNLSQPIMQINARNFYSHLNLLTMKWAQSLNQREWTRVDMIRYAV